MCLHVVVSFLQFAETVPFLCKTNVHNERSRTEQYLKLFDSAPPSTVAIGEGSTVYLASSNAVQRIIAFQPNAKFIVMLRNPVDLVVSSHMQEQSHLNENVESFETAWQLQDERCQGNMMPAQYREHRSNHGSPAGVMRSHRFL